MSWKYQEPRPDDYIEAEEYYDALDAYEDAEAEYCDSYVENSRLRAAMAEEL